MCLLLRKSRLKNFMPCSSAVADSVWLQNTGMGPLPLQSLCKCPLKTLYFLQETSPVAKFFKARSFLFLECLFLDSKLCTYLELFHLGFSNLDLRHAFFSFRPFFQRRGSRASNRIRQQLIILVVLHTQASLCVKTTKIPPVTV